MHGGSNLTQIVELSLKKWFIGQHTQASRSRTFIGEGNLHRIEVAANDSLAGAGFLDLGNQLDAAPRGERREKVPNRRCVLNPSLQFAKWHGFLGARDLLPFR